MLYVEAEGKGTKFTYRTGKVCTEHNMVAVLQDMKMELRDYGYTDIRTFYQYWDEVVNNPHYERIEVIVL